MKFQGCGAVLLALGVFFASPGMSAAQTATNATLSPESRVAIRQYMDAYGVADVGGGKDAGKSFVAKTLSWLIFGGIGFVAFVYGKKESRWKPLVIGLALMSYPYFISSPWGLFAVGAALTALLYFWRD